MVMLLLQGLSAVRNCFCGIFVFVSFSSGLALLKLWHLNTSLGFVIG